MIDAGEPRKKYKNQDVAISCRFHNQNNPVQWHADEPNLITLRDCVNFLL